jgi:hypothetical protein
MDYRIEQFPETGEKLSDGCAVFVLDTGMDDRVVVRADCGLVKMVSRFQRGKTLIGEGVCVNAGRGIITWRSFEHPIGEIITSPKMERKNNE